MHFTSTCFNYARTIFGLIYQAEKDNFIDLDKEEEEEEENDEKMECDDDSGLNSESVGPIYLLQLTGKFCLCLLTQKM